jgi:nitrite reductase (cytochrome c-552)
VKANIEAKAAWDAGATDKDMEAVLNKIRSGQWYWDYATASHGASFHSPIEVTRIIGNGMYETQDARVLLARLLVKLGKNNEIPYPDIATKDKAQKFIGLDMNQLRKEKEKFLKTMVPGWDKRAKERESKWKVVVMN